jgi:formamidopyrimidine-DNA glycosylase
MPELPEVEVIRRELDALVTGSQLVRVETVTARVLRRGSLAGVEGRFVKSVMRHGKFVSVALEGDISLVVHLGMSGRLSLASGTQSKRHLAARMVFDSSEVCLVDPRTFGQVFALAGGKTVREVVGLGPDLLEEPEASIVALRSGLKSRRSIKAVLLDQHVVAGMGNMYADEVMFRIGRHPNEMAGAIADKDFPSQVVETSLKVFTEAIRNGGTTFRDRGYADLYGRYGNHSRHLLVYGRHGLPCYLCGRLVIRERFGNRHSHLCPRCQRSGCEA